MGSRVSGSPWDPKGGGKKSVRSRWEATRRKSLAIQQRVGADRKKMRKRQEEPVSTEIVPGKRYTQLQLAAIADQILRDDAKSELCRKCGDRGIATGTIKPMYQEAQDTGGNALVLDFPEMKCANGHQWYQSEGTVRGIGGDNPILFEEHFQSRKRREIYTTLGTPDPSIVAGMYNKTHPQGRKVNSEEQRKRNGASFFR